MSTIDTLMPLVSGPWLDSAVSYVPSTPASGLSSQAIQALELSFRKVSNERRKLLGFCSGLRNTVLGSLDFTGCLFPPEPLAVFHPSITLAIDDSGRRWVAETSDTLAISGPVWCVFPEPKVALQVADDLPHFLTILKAHTCDDTALAWLQHLDAEARRIWSQRHSAAVRPYQASKVDAEIRDWMATLPADAFVYDLREARGRRGWP